MRRNIAYIHLCNELKKFSIKKNNLSTLLYLLLGSFTFSLAIDLIGVLNQHGADMGSTFLAFIFVVGVCALLIKLLAKFQDNTQLKWFRFVVFGVAWFIILTIISFNFPLKSMVNINNHIPEVILLDDLKYTENPNYEYFSRGSAGSYSSNYKFYIPVEYFYDGLKINNGIIKKYNSSYIYTYWIDNTEYTVDVNIEKSAFKKYAYMLGYRDFQANDKLNKSWILPVAYLGHFILKNTFYIISLTLITFLIYIKSPEKLFKKTSHSNSL